MKLYLALIFENTRTVLRLFVDFVGRPSSHWLLSGCQTKTNRKSKTSSRTKNMSTNKSRRWGSHSFTKQTSKRGLVRNSLSRIFSRATSALVSSRIPWLAGNATKSTAVLVWKRVWSAKIIARCAKGTTARVNSALGLEPNSTTVSSRAKGVTRNVTLR